MLAPHSLRYWFSVSLCCAYYQFTPLFQSRRQHNALQTSVIQSKSISLPIFQPDFDRKIFYGTEESSQTFRLSDRWSRTINLVSHFFNFLSRARYTAARIRRQFATIHNCQPAQLRLAFVHTARVRVYVSIWSLNVNMKKHWKSDAVNDSDRRPHVCISMKGRWRKEKWFSGCVAGSQWMGKYYRTFLRCCHSHSAHHPSQSITAHMWRRSKSSQLNMNYK